MAERRRRRLAKLKQLRTMGKAQRRRLTHYRQQRMQQSCSRKITMKCGDSKRTCGASCSTYHIRLKSKDRSKKSKRVRRKKLK